MSVSAQAAKQIYREAIDPSASDFEPADWWESVAAEVRAVLEAPTISSAARIICWWHHDWSAVGDSPKAAAKRLRQVGKRTVVKMS